MIKLIKHKPKGFFKQLPDDKIWFECYDENDTYAYVGIDIVKRWASFHIHIVRWSHNVAKSLKSDWIELKTFCRDYNVSELIASNDNISDKRWPKFIKLFGFPYPTTVLISKQEI